MQLHVTVLALLATVTLAAPAPTFPTTPAPWWRNFYGDRTKDVGPSDRTSNAGGGDGPRLTDTAAAVQSSPNAATPANSTVQANGTAPANVTAPANGTTPAAPDRSNRDSLPADPATLR